MPASDLAAQTRESVERMQNFDTSTLPRMADLGKDLNFKDSVPHAERLVGMYQRLSLKALDDLPDANLNQIKQRADADYNVFSQALEFKTDQASPVNQRKSIMQSIEGAYDQSFAALSQWVSYGASVAVDFQRLETEARASVQAVKDQGAEMAEEMQSLRDQAGGILAEVRKVAAEQGVTQQAEYFKSEADRHDEEADRWKKQTFLWALGLGVYALLSLGLHKIDWLAPENLYQAIQLATSKVLIFGVISYMLFLAARNFLSHRHNAIINRHRQNALLTFKALVDAAKDEAVQDIVLTHAAACIFAPQETGYSRGRGKEGHSTNIFEMLPRPMVKLGGEDT